MNEFLARINHPLLQRIISLLPENLPMYLVGGAVRDAFLNRSSYDLDFVTSSDAIKIARQVANKLGAAFYPLDNERNVARIIVKPEGQNDVDKPVRIDFSTFQGRDLISDLHGRDFTVNAMAVEIHNLSELVDPLGGTADLLARHLRLCSVTSLLDDPVRVLRAVRFSVNLDLVLPPETMKLIREAVGRIPEVSAERLRDELFRILSQSRTSTSIRILDKIGALVHILPELGTLKGVRQSSPHVRDVWEHTLDVLTRLESLLPVVAAEFDPEKTGNLIMGTAAIRLGRFRQQLSDHLACPLNQDRSHRGLLMLACLYHDVGKPVTQSAVESGKIRFFEHEQVGSKVVEERARALRLSNIELDRLVTIVRQHMRPSLLSHERQLPSRKAIYRFFRDSGAAGIDICILSLADVLATYGPTLPQERWDRQLEIVRSLLSAWWEEHEAIVLPQPLVKGDELIQEFSLSPGPIIGQVLEAIREGQVAGEIHTREEAISLARDLLTDPG
jgi:putative nucleotidyltransferase with HDIG domain